MTKLRRSSCRVFAALALCGVGQGLVGCNSVDNAAETDAVARVKVDRVRREPVAQRVSLVGTITPIETSIVAAEAAGVVRRYPVREGQYVRQGEPLAELADASLEIELKRAEALLREKQQQYQELKAGYRPEEIAQAEARMRAAEAAIHLAESQEARLRDLEQRNIGAVTDQDLDLARYETEKARQSYIEAKADYELKLSGNRPEVVAAAEAAMQAAEHEVRRLEDEIRRHTVRAPFDGFVVSEHTDVGQWVDVGGPVATLARLDEVEVRVQVEETAIHLVRPGDLVQVQIDALPGETFTGRVEAIVPRANWQAGSRSFPVIVRLENSIVDGQPRLKEGMLARLAFQGPAEPRLLVHKDAIVRSTGEPVVFVVGQGGVVRAVPVQEGPAQGAYVAVSGELTAGDIIVTEGVERLRPFDRVAFLNDPPAVETGIAADAPGEASQTGDADDSGVPAHGNTSPGGL